MFMFLFFFFFLFIFFFLMIRRPPRSTLFPYTSSSDLMAEKKSKTKAKVSTTKTKATKSKATTTKPKTTSKAKTTKSKAKGSKSQKKEEPVGDMGIVIVDDDIEIDQEKVNEERRAYLEEARSQEAFD